MLTYCCVFNCIKKGYREDDGSKVFYFVFFIEKIFRKKWIYVIRREEGKNFIIKFLIKVCFRYFREYEFKKFLVGKMFLRLNVVFSLFSWIRISLRKRKALILRELESGRESSFIISDKINEENIMDVFDDDFISDISEET